MLLVVLACLIQVSTLAAYPLMPELPLALAAWAMIDGSEDGMPVRAWSVGFIYDLFDPGSVYFHAIAYLVIALALLPVRNLLFRRRVAGWAGWAATCSLLMVLVDGWAGGWGDQVIVVVLAQAVLTAAAAAGLGWLVGVIPHPWHPLGKGGA